MAEARTKKRRRRRPEEAEAEILAAAEALVRTRPWREITVERVMAETTLARESFYLYFADRHQLLVRLLARMRAQIDEQAAEWREGRGDVYESGRAAFRGLVELYIEHGALLRALSEAARQDEAAEEAWRAFLDAGESRTAERIRQGIREGRIAPLDADETARALCAMNREYLFLTVVGRPDVDVDSVVDTLHGIWWRALYGDLPMPAREKRRR